MRQPVALALVLPVFAAFGARTSLEGAQGECRRTPVSSRLARAALVFAGRAIRTDTFPSRLDSPDSSQYVFATRFDVDSLWKGHEELDRRGEVIVYHGMVLEIDFPRGEAFLVFAYRGDPLPALLVTNDCGVRPLEDDFAQRDMAELGPARRAVRAP